MVMGCDASSVIVGDRISQGVVESITSKTVGIIRFGFAGGNGLTLADNSTVYVHV